MKKKVLSQFSLLRLLSVACPMIDYLLIMNIKAAMHNFNNLLSYCPVSIKTAPGT